MGIFQTERPMSPRAVLEQRRKDELERQINRNLLSAQNELEQQAVIEQAAMVADSNDAEKKAKMQAMQEALAHRTKFERMRKAHTEALTTMPKKSREQLIENFLLDIIYESLWVDESIKGTDASQEAIVETFHTIVEKCENVTGQALMSNMNKTKLLSYISEVTGYVSDKACKRILAEAAETGDVTINFDLNDEESDELFDKMTDINPDAISQFIRNKVLDTVKDEKECGQVKAEIFKELDAAETEEENPENESGIENSDTATPDDTTEDDAEATAESFVGSPLNSVLEAIRNKDNIHNGYNIRVLMKLGDKEVLHENFDNAIACYTAAMEAAETLRNMNRVMLPKEYEYVKESLVNAMTSRNFSISPTSGKATVREDKDSYICESLNETLLDINKYCGLMESAVSNRNVRTKTVAEIFAQKRANRINRGIMRNAGKSLFEHLLIINTRNAEQSNPVLENGSRMVQEEIDNAAMLQTLLEYTVFETLNTLKIFDFNSWTLDKIKAV